MERLELDDIALFVTTVRHGSISQAASALQIAKSTLSRRLQQLEQKLGVRLIERSTRQLDLTEAGASLLAQAAPHLDELSAIRQHVSAYGRQPTGHLNILVPQELFSTEIAELISEFMHRYPDINLSCTQYSGDPPTPDPNYDLLFLLHDHPLPATDWIARPLMSIPQGLFIATSLQGKAPTDLASLAQCPCILRTGESYWRFRHHQDIVDCAVNGRLHLSSTDMQLQAAANGLGIARLPIYQAAPIVRRQRLCALHLELEPVALQLSVLYRSRHLPLKTRLFVEHFQNQIGRLYSLV